MKFLGKPLNVLAQKAKFAPASGAPTQIKWRSYPGFVVCVRQVALSYLGLLVGVPQAAPTLGLL